MGICRVFKPILVKTMIFIANATFNYMGMSRYELNMEGEFSKGLVIPNFLMP